MFFPQLGILGQLTIISLLASLLQQCSATEASAYCSTLNTGADNEPNQSIYQSSGKCSSYCSAFAFGILQGKLCWCSNYAPDVSTSSSACSDPCPGYPSDTCGSASGGLYEYLSLNALPSGTEGSGSSVAAQTTNVQVTVTASPPAPVTVTETAPSPIPSSSSIASSISSVVTTISTSSGAPLSTTAPLTTSSNAVATTTSSHATTASPTPVATTETIINPGGGFSTVTVTSSPSSAASETLSSDQHHSNGNSLSGGKAAGLAIGLIAFLALVGGIGYFCWRKRKNNSSASEYGGISRHGSTLVAGAAQPPSRTMSENSRYVLTTDGRAVYPAWEDDNHAGARSSRLVPIDPRLDPYNGIYQQPGAIRRSRDSVNTLNDGHDYSRKVAKPVLRAMNPDPDTPKG